VAAHRFRLELAGQMVYGVAFATEAELEEFLGSRGIALVQAQTPAAPIEAGHEPQRGRPSFGAVIAAAVAELDADIAGCDSLSARARLVLQHLAKSHAAEELPSTRCVTRYLSEQPIGQKYGNKYGRKSERAKIRRI
jgi:hypothetical protein